MREGRLRFTSSHEEAIAGAEFAFVAVATPEGDSGSADLTFVTLAAEEIARTARGPLVAVNKSTVPVGTGDMVAGILNARRQGAELEVVSNPELLREGQALSDCFHPYRIVVGARRRETAERVAALYSTLDAPVLLYDLRTTEMVKYASNAFLATKVSFINEMARICDKVGADACQVAEWMGLDRRIGPDFLRAGLG